MTLQNSQGGSEGSNPFGATGPLTSGNVREGAGSSRPRIRIWRQIGVICAAASFLACAPAYADETPAPEPTVSSTPTPEPSPSGVTPTPTASPVPSATATATPTATTPTGLTALDVKAIPAGKRLVTADATAVVSTGAAAYRGAAFALRLTCGNTDMGAIQNTPKGSTLTLHPRLLVDGADKCTIYGASGMPARQTAALRYGGAVGGVMGYTPTLWPNRIVPGQSYDYLPAEWTVPAGVPAVTVTGDQKVTTCTSWGGSRDNGSPYLCEGHENVTGSTVRLQVWAQQRNTAGGYCASKIVSSRDHTITAASHHFMSYKQGSFTLSTAAGCTRSVRVKVRATLISGSDLVLHRPGSATTLFAATP